MSVASNIAAAFERSGLKQVEFADMLGVREGALSYWLSGTRAPDLQSTFTIALALGTTIDAMDGDKLPPLGDPAPRAVVMFAESFCAVIDSTPATVLGTARAAKVSRGSAFSWRRGDHDPTPAAAKRVAAVLGYSVHAMCLGPDALGLCETLRGT